MKKLLILITTFLFVLNLTIYAENGNASDAPNLPLELPPLNFQVDGDKTVIGKPGEQVTINLFASFNPYGLEDGAKLIVSADAGSENNLYLSKPYNEIDFRDFRYDYYRGSSATRFSFVVNIANNAKAGTYPIKIDFSANNKTITTYTAYVRVEYDENQETRLVLDDLKIFPSTTVAPGENVVCGIIIKNPTENPVYKTELRLEGMSSDGFTLLKDFNAKNIQTISPGSDKRLSFELGANTNSKPGNYEFKVIVSYSDPGSENNIAKVEKSFYLTIGNNLTNKSSLIVSNLVTPSKTLYPGNQATISFDVENKGNTTAKRITVKSSIDGAGLVNKSVNQHFLEKLEPGEKQSFSFSYLATPASTTQNYPIAIKIEYFDEYQTNSEPQISEQYSGIFVLNPEKDESGSSKKKSTPKLIVSKYSFTPKLPEAGQEFEMNLSFQNTSSDKTVKNIKISLNSPQGVDKQSTGSNIFTPVDSSNTFFIDKIAPGQVVDKLIRLYTVPDATAKTYNVQCSFEYEDMDNNEFKAEEEVGIPVVQPSKLEIGEIQTNPTFEAGMGSPVSVTFYNTGKVTLYNMMVRFESDDLEAQNSTYYIGKFLEGSTEQYDVQVNSMEPGEKKGAIVFTYEDSTGQKQEIKKELTFTVNEMPPMDPNQGMDDMPIDEPSGGLFSKIKNIASKWYFWVILIAVFGAIFFIVKKIKKNKEIKDLTLDV